MRDPEELWPCEKLFSPSLEEEFRKDMMEGACNIVKGVQELSAGGTCFPAASKGGLDRLVRVYGYVISLSTNGGRKRGLEDPSSSTLLRTGREESDIPQLSADRRGNNTCLGWPRKGWGYLGQRCWPRTWSLKKTCLDRGGSLS
jgi:hypothetical protein